MMEGGYEQRRLEAGMIILFLGLLDADTSRLKHHCTYLYAVYTDDKFVGDCFLGT